MHLSRPVWFALALLVLLQPRSALAQHEERRGFVGLSIGPSQPIGAFADASRANTRAGQATSGYYMDLNLARRFGSRVGVAAASSFSDYEVRQPNVGEKWWEVSSLTVGPMYTLPFSAKGAIDLKMMFGLVTMTPMVDLIGDSYIGEDGMGRGLGADLRVAVRYDVFRQWAVFMEGGLQSANVSFKTDVRKDYRALNTGAGIAFRPTW